ncbi:MAG: hypothetical protein VCD31_16935, partial [Alphaproteobacteria bacterium]
SVVRSFSAAVFGLDMWRSLKAIMVLFSVIDTIKPLTRSPPLTGFIALWRDASNHRRAGGERLRSSSGHADSSA